MLSETNYAEPETDYFPKI